VPEVPDVVGDTPHLRIGAHFVDLLDGAAPGERLRTSAVRFFRRAILSMRDVVALYGRAADAIGLDQVHAPTGIEPGD